MPLVFSMHEATVSGVVYTDVPFMSYEYPPTYRALVTPGERFVYYRGRQQADGGSQKQVYLGTGIISNCRPSHNGDRLVCDVLDGHEFDAPLFFRDASNNHFEPGGARRGHFHSSVRWIDDATFARILSAADAAPMPAPTRLPAPAGVGHGMYATPHIAREVKLLSRRVAAAMLADRYGCRVTAMPLNNPGFDLQLEGGPLRYVTVCGTQAPEPRFMLSEGERMFAREHAAEYGFVVVYGINLQRGTHRKPVLQTGAIEHYATLAPTQWSGVASRSRAIRRQSSP
jgi:hypothetical protein